MSWYIGFIIFLEMGGNASSGNSVGFRSQLESGRLPQMEHITYDGVFNELTFKIGSKTNQLL